MDEVVERDVIEAIKGLLGDECDEYDVIYAYEVDARLLLL